MLSAVVMPDLTNSDEISSQNNSPTDSIEKTGPSFSVTKALSAREKTWDAIYKVAGSIRPGMTEEEATQIAKENLKKMGVEKNWHKVLVRFGPNTLKSFSERSEPNVILQKNDLFFLDFGPVWDNHEGDAGETFVVGESEDLLKCKLASNLIFEEVKQYWLKNGCTGERLYAFAASAAERKGWVLNRKTRGHRLSDFPHMLYSKTKLAELTVKPKEHLWVLEIQLRHPIKPYGSFYEDLLLR